MIIWSDTSIAFDLYRRTNLAETPGKWERIGEEIELTVPDGDDRRGVSLTRILQKGNNPQFQQLNQLLEENQYEYAVHFTRVGTLGDRDTWSQRVTMGVTVVAGSASDLGSLANGRLDSSALEEALAEGVTNIGQPGRLYAAQAVQRPRPRPSLWITGRTLRREIPASKCT